MVQGTAKLAQQCNTFQVGLDKRLDSSMDCNMYCIFPDLILIQNLEIMKSVIPALWLPHTVAVFSLFI